MANEADDHDGSLTAAAAQAARKASVYEDAMSTPVIGAEASPKLEQVTEEEPDQVATPVTAKAPNGINHAASPPTSTTALPQGDVARSDANDPNSVLVATLRLQNNDLQSQVTGLNAKLVNSFGRLGDLEESLDRATHDLEEARTKCEKLTEERSRWEERVEGGMLVEKVHVQTELTRMMDRVIEETAQRGKAEADKATIERELDELSASLFAEANRMVTVEREGRLRAEEKSSSLEDRLKDTEGIMGHQADQMRELGRVIESIEQERDELRARMVALEHDPALLASRSVAATPEAPAASFPDGEVVALSQPASPRVGVFNPLHALPELQTDILPHHEFHIFIRHLHRLRVNTLSRPYESANPIVEAQRALQDLLPLAQHLSQPFLKRCVEEDSDPTLRLDLAPGLNWLTRRNVSQAIVDGQLVIEPHYGALPPSEKCALCGASLDRYLAEADTALPAVPVSGGQAAIRKLVGTQAWTRWGGRVSTPPPSTTTAPTSVQHPAHASPIHVFRPHDATSTGVRTALCPTYCLPRLRAVCEFWTAIRNIERSLLMGDRAPTVGLASGSREAAGRKGLGLGVNMAGLLRRTASGDASARGSPSTEVTPQPTPILQQQAGLAVPTPSIAEEMSASPIAETGPKSADAEAEVAPPSESTASVPVVSGPSSDGESSGAITASEGSSSSTADPELPADAPATDVTDVDSTEPRDGAEAKAPTTPPAAPAEKLSTPPLSGEARTPSPSLVAAAASPKPPPLPKRSEARAPRAGSPAPPSRTTVPPPPTAAQPAAEAALATAPRIPARRNVPSAPSVAVARPTILRQPSLDTLTASATPIQAAWEDKAWQELVRLREALFWVRVGAVVSTSAS